MFVWDLHLARYLQSRTKELGHEALSMLIIRWFLPFLLEKRGIFQHRLGGMGDTWYSSSAPTTFGQDCRKDPLRKKIKYREFDHRGTWKDINQQWQIVLSCAVRLQICIIASSATKLQNGNWRAWCKKGFLNEQNKYVRHRTLLPYPPQGPPTQSVLVADCYFIENVLDLPFASPTAIYR